MDSLTHIALGAIIGEACLGKRLGKRAMLLGAVAQSLPDIDFIASFWMSTAENLLAHRGFTHSILFGILASIVLALLSERWHRPHNIMVRQWILFFCLEIFVHLFLDAFNNYGVGWFEPFNHTRISFNAIFVADPFFSVWAGIASIALLILNRKSTTRKYWVRTALVITSLYLAYAVYNKSIITNSLTKNLKHQNMAYQRFFTTPTALNNWLWYTVVEDKTGYHIGYRSVFDRNPAINFRYFPRQEALLKKTKHTEDVQRLIRFSQGYYTVDNKGDTIVFNDLRFGQIMGWHDPEAGFTFHYYVDYPDKNSLVIQRGRFSGWNEETIKSLIVRIQGN